MGLALVLTLYGGTAAAVTLLALARRRRRRERAEFAAVLDSLHDPHALLRPIRNPNGRIIDFQVAQLNQAAHRYNGPQPGPPGSRTLLEWMPDHQPSGLLSAYANAMELGEVVVLDDVPLQHPVHGARRFEIRAVRVDQMLCVSWRDVTERRQLIERLAESEKQFRLLAENASDVVLRVSGSRLVQWVSPALTAMLGWVPQEWIGRPVEELLLPSLSVEAAPRESGPAPVGIERRRVADSNGQLHWIEIHSSAVQGDQQQPDGWEMSFRTIDAEVALELDLEQRARFDPLTGLLNRGEILQRLQALSTGRRRRGDGRLMLLFCDLDRFKEVNDRHGHQAGDAVLRAVADRVHAVVRRGDLAGRMGGDELLVVLVGIQEPADALAVAEKLRRSLAEPIPWEGEALRISVSIGLTEMAPEESVDEALHRADQGMYRAKRSGRDGVVAL
ncbi:MAG: sensor domain-containing diguanylate cyclase [Synechococcus sp.]|nr:sensor domain-containing diguanylate cyclase [Synechococcus sp.]